MCKESSGLLHEYPDHPKLEAPLLMLLRAYIYHESTQKSTVTVEKLVGQCPYRSAFLRRSHIRTAF